VVHALLDPQSRLGEKRGGEWGGSRQLLFRSHIAVG
jgi:hypothetical protein